jgi:NTE family protein
VTTAFVLSGGAAHGAVQAGMLMALDERNIRPDLIVGTSVGAINGAWLAGHPPGDSDLAGLANLWRSLKRSQVFPTRPLLGLRGFLGQARNLVPAGPLRRLVRQHVTFERLEDAHVPLHALAADVLTGEGVLLSTGDTVDAVVASASIPAVFPPVKIGERYLMDGGVVNNTPICQAVELGADRIWVMPTGYACALTEPPAGALAMALHGVMMMINQRLGGDVVTYESQVDLRVVPPPCPIRTSPADFSHGAELIERGHDTAVAWLDGNIPDLGAAVFLDPHHHG